MSSPYYIFREPETVNELKSLLLLRESVNREPRSTEGFRKHGYDGKLDYFDLCSHHFGLYEHQGKSSRPVGYVRVTTECSGPKRSEVGMISHECLELNRRLQTVPAVPFPILTIYPMSEEIQQICASARANGEKVAEVGRFSLDPTVRSVQMTTDFLSATCAAVIVSEITHCIHLCASTQLCVFQSLGFREIAGMEQTISGNGNMMLHVLRTDTRELPEIVRDRVLDMAAAFFQTGRIQLNLATPGVFFPPLSSFVPSRPALRAAA